MAFLFYIFPLIFNYFCSAAYFCFQTSTSFILRPYWRSCARGFPASIPCASARRCPVSRILTPNIPTCSVLGVNSPSNILLLHRLVVECSVLSLFISPESYSGISVMVLPLSVHTEYPCVPLGSLVLGDNPLSKKTQENAIFLAHLQILLYLCRRFGKALPITTYVI